MLRTVATLLTNGGVPRALGVRERVAKRFQGKTVDALLADGIIAPASLGQSLNIVFASCSPTSDHDVDLREFVEGARHAVHTSVQHMFSKSMVQCQLDRTTPSEEANAFLMAACAPPLYQKLLDKKSHSVTPTQYAVPQRVKKCAIVSAKYTQEPDEDEVLKFTVASDLVCVMKPLSEDPPSSSETNKTLDDKTVEVAVTATFRTNIVPSGNLDWILENVRMAKLPVSAS
ncbi:hypothetical protein SDRG_00826 [Saprolegnia diclina VS20]|uniref:Tim44-like domain-containing protein n=1 Tax=Saprolegnia diclina (strain VS20) TaxID=1156394 RepID=T0SGG2_SAPDV|nr:hypothetical protein SDRG_00826 [Saprolegnia diclina VS20]EQC41977.1 hypothetical protein SDRG_00826 [Saprolegnia diclina VS20]|eukprot:XP_008604546.1 hypothetical protein SDRG_00826 [Saprolegnia diclina VS20]